MLDHSAVIVYLIHQSFSYVGHGATRSTYLRNDIVIKVPRHNDGYIDNDLEARIYSKYRDQADNYYAPCRLIYRGKLAGCLMMRALEPLGRFRQNSNIPDWAFDLPDGPQIGTDRNGRWWAYDYAHYSLLD